MGDRYSLDEIREFWKRQAIEHGQSPAASWSDRIVIELEIREIVEHLADGDRVLDVGCANGYSTMQFASQRRIHIRGVDCVPEMIEQACLRLRGQEEGLLGSVEFEVGDVSRLDEPTDSYDKVIVVRVLINLAEKSRQEKGLSECIRVLKPGGVLLLSEATVQGWERLNRFRREWHLPDIPMPPHNLYLDQEALIQAASPHLQLLEVRDFASTYYVGTRVLKPLLIEALGSDVDVADPNMDWNRWFGQLPAWGDYGTQKLLVFRKR